MLLITQMLGYANNIIITSRKLNDEEELLHTFDTGKEFGRRINEDKTKIIMQSRSTSPAQLGINVGDLNIEVANS